MRFRTELSLPPSHSIHISHSDKIITIGSCFAELIGQKLSFFKFHTLNNPFGTIFNPLSVSKLLQQSLFGEKFPDNSYVYTRGLWFNYFTHSSLFAVEKKTLEDTIKKKSIEVRKILEKGDILICTLGTSFIYKHLEKNILVSNCHKTSQEAFTKILLSAKEITEDFISTFSAIHQSNPKLKIILSVSPVRHLKDTLILNSVSKSILRIVAYELEQTFPFVSYFPAYELINDDLRDYRFYKEDLIHPTPFAESYIWEKFSACYFKEQTRQLNQRWSMLEKNIQHKPLQESSADYKDFLKNTVQKLQDIATYLPVKKEIDEINKKIHLL